jgi:hypothetical protein
LFTQIPEIRDRKLVDFPFVFHQMFIFTAHSHAKNVSFAWQVYQGLKPGINKKSKPR